MKISEEYRLAILGVSIILANIVWRYRDTQGKQWWKAQVKVSGRDLSDPRVQSMQSRDFING